MFTTFDSAVQFGSAAEVVETFMQESNGDPVGLLAALKRDRTLAFNAVLCSRYQVAAYMHDALCDAADGHHSVHGETWFLSILVGGELDAAEGQLDVTYKSRADAEAAAVALFELEARFISDLLV